MDMKRCITCAEEIPASAIKCNKCGSYQNWRRHIDFGQGALALLVALISVSTLAVDTGVRAINAALSNPLEPRMAAKVISLSIDEIKILVANNGTSRVFLSEGALCRVPVVRKGVSLVTDDASLVRYPKRSEIEAVYTVQFGRTPSGSRFVEPATGALITVPRGSVLREEGLPLKESVVEVRGYCFVRWIGQDSDEGGDFLQISALDSQGIGEELANLPPSETINGKQSSQVSD